MLTLEILLLTRGHTQWATFGGGMQTFLHTNNQYITNPSHRHVVSDMGKELSC